MHEPALLTRRALAAALPIAALAGAAPTPAAAVPALAGTDDAALVDLGRQWQAACAALHAHDLCVERLPAGQMTDALEKLGDRLYEEERPLFEAAMDMRPRTVEGLAIKGHMLARAFDVLAPTDKALEAAIERSGDFQTHAALTLALDILRLARMSA